MHIDFQCSKESFLLMEERISDHEQILAFSKLQQSKLEKKIEQINASSAFSAQQKPSKISNARDKMLISDVNKYAQEVIH